MTQEIGTTQPYLVIEQISTSGTYAPAGTSAARALALALVAPDRGDFHYATLSPRKGIDASTQIGRFTAQVKYGHNASLPFSWRLSARNQAEAAGRPVTTNMSLSVGRRCTNWHYNTHVEPASYRFHSTLTKFNYCGDAPWTYHRPHPGYLVDINIVSTYPVSHNRIAILTCHATLKLVS
ncbi:MAG TPA: hypothetical protein VLJ59_19200 [Mycobacteriales bacterium]|nr:hypothetical protein [Mycobacteriales bacterium]